MGAKAMALASTDERDLLLPLYNGIHEDPLWQTFLRRLQMRTEARYACLIVQGGGQTRPALRRVVKSGMAGSSDTFDIGRLGNLGLPNYGMLRPNRVYSLEELLIFDDDAAAQRQRQALAEANVADARCIRVPVGEHGIWVFLLHDRREFTAADSALLSAIGPHLGAALGTLLEIDALRLRAAMAEDALAAIGVGQAAFDAEGRVVAADAIAAEDLDAQPGSRLRAREAQSLGGLCGEMVHAPASNRRVLRIDERRARDMLLRPAPAMGTGLPTSAAAVGLVRRPADRADTAAPVIAATLGLSTREAALAGAIGQGRAIVEAGAELQLTRETARNYSKRIYAKTGASGQADLVRLLWSGLTPFARIY
jgi:DNA-binding CsgD family transcriptional regulator